MNHDGDCLPNRFGNFIPSQDHRLQISVKFRQFETFGATIMQRRCSAALPAFFATTIA